MKKSLLVRIGVTVLIVGFIMITGLFVFLALKVVEADNQAKAITAQLTSQSVLDKIDRNFYERFGDVQAFACNALAVNTMVQDSVSPDAQKFINTMTTYYVLYDLMILCNKEGRVLAVNTVNKDGKKINTESLIGKDYSGEEWFKTCLYPATLQGAWYSDFTVNQDIAHIYHNNGYGMAFAAPIKNASDEVIGVWYNFASWKEITESIHQEAENEIRKQDPNAVIIITKADGTVIQSSDPKLIQNKSLKINETSSPNEKVIFNSNHTTYGSFISEWADSRGAYTYKAKNWKAVTLLTRSTITLATFFSSQLLPAIIFISVTILFLMIVAFVFMRKNIYKKIIEIQNVLTKLTNGELTEIGYNLKTADEFGSIVTSIGELTEAIQTKAMFADEIAKGDLKANLTNISAKDVLGVSLVNMRNQLAKAAEDNKRRSWTTEGLAGLTEILRSNHDMKELSENVIRYIIKYLGANQGSVFIAEKENQQTILALQACYAYDRKKILEKRIVPGEGLAGQAYLEGDYIYLTQIPENHVSITSGLGQSLPRCILIMPLKNNDKIEGVIELAAFNNLEDFEIEFVQLVAENIASVINNVRNNELTRRLLQESKRQNEEMQAQEEEMRQNMEEMQATQEEMRRKDLEISALLGVVNDSLALVEFDLEGNILTANDNFLKIMHYSIEEIKSRHHRIFVEKEFAESKTYKDFWSDLQQGKTFSGTFSRITKDRKPIQIQASYRAVYNNDGKPYKIIKAAFVVE
jgi:PAS domain S-box-containing protein